MKKTIKMFVCLLISLIVGISFFFFYRSYSCKKSLTPISSSVYQTQFDTINELLLAVKNKDNKALIEEFYLESFPDYSSYNLVSWDIFDKENGTLTFDESNILNQKYQTLKFYVLLHFEEKEIVDNITFLQVIDNNREKGPWVLWEMSELINPFLYKEYQQIYYQNNMNLNILISILVMLLSFFISYLIIYITDKPKLVKNKRKQAIEFIKSSGFSSTSKKVINNFTIAFDDNRKEWLVLSDAGINGRIFNFDEIVNVKNYHPKNEIQDFIVVKVTTSDLSYPSISIPIQNKVVSEEIVSMFQSAKENA